MRAKNARQRSRCGLRSFRCGFIDENYEIVQLENFHQNDKGRTIILLEEWSLSAYKSKNQITSVCFNLSAAKHTHSTKRRVEVINALVMSSYHLELQIIIKFFLGLYYVAIVANTAYGDKMPFHINTLWKTQRKFLMLRAKHAGFSFSHYC